MSRRPDILDVVFYRTGGATSLSVFGSRANGRKIGSVNKHKHIGSRFDDFLKEERILSEAQTVAVKRVIAYQLAQEMKRHKMSKSAMALKMKTSRASLDRLLDPGNSSVTLQTLERAARALGKTLVIELA